MDARKVSNMLSERDIWTLLEDLDAKPRETATTIESETVCHHGDSHKLYYYKDSNHFYCYTGCGSMSVFDLVMKSLDMEFSKALSYIVRKFNISGATHFEDGFTFAKVENPGEKLRQKLKKVDMPSIETLEENRLDGYYDLFHKSWLEDGICTRSMRKHDVKFSVLNNQIIIPHRNSDHKLIGIRARNLNITAVTEGRKYVPVLDGKTVLKHPTGANLYGLSQNRASIELHKKCILFESEKAVLQLDTMLPDFSIGLCVSGSSLTLHQLEILKELNIDEVVIGMDKEYDEIGSEEEVFYAQRVRQVFQKKLAPFFRVSVLWDMNNLLNKKDSPTDRGLEVFQELYTNRIYL